MKLKFHLKSFPLTMLCFALFFLLPLASCSSLSFFRKPSSLYDALATRTSGCDLRLDRHLVVFCKDGYVAIDPLPSFIANLSN